MSLRLFMVIAVTLAASPVAAEDSAIRLFAPVPNGAPPTEQTLVRQRPAQQAWSQQHLSRKALSQKEGAIRLFSPAQSPSSLGKPQAAPPIMRGTVRETVTAQARPVDRAWVIAPR